MKGSWVNKQSWKPDCVLEEVTRSHKGIYSISWKFKSLCLVKDHMCWPCVFLLFSDVFCAVLGPVSYLEDWNPQSPKDQRRSLICYKICCSCFLSQKQPIEPSLATSLSFLVCVPLSLSAVMDSTPPTSKRIKIRVVRSGGRLEGWFSRDNELIERYRFETSTKVINNPKVVSFD